MSRVKHKTNLACCIALLLGLSPSLAAATQTTDASAAAKSTYLEARVPMSLKQVSEHVWYAQGEAGPATFNDGFISNAGVIITAEGVVVVDALGSPSLAQKLRGLIREKTDLPVRYVVVTHYHADHIYGLQVFKDEGAKIFAPSGADEYLADEGSDALLQDRRITLFPWIDEKTRLVEPDTLVGASQSFTLGGLEFEMRYEGAAHSHGDLTLFVKPDRVLFSGDLIFEGRVPFVGDADTRQWMQSLDSLMATNPKVLVPGHGGVATEPTEALKATRDYMAFLREQLQVAVDEFTAFDEAYAAIDWSRFEALPAFEEANRRNAYQVYLALEQESL